MNLGLSALFLILGSFLSSSATSDEECRALVTPLSTFEPQLGRWNFVLGYIDSNPHKVLFETTETQWIKYVKTGTDSHPVYQQLIGIKHPTYCKYGTFPMTLHYNSAVMDTTCKPPFAKAAAIGDTPANPTRNESNFTCTYHPLPTCEDCLLYLVNARNNDIIVNSRDNPNPQTISQVKHYRAFYMMVKGNSISDSDLEHGKKQARCLGFTGEPDFVLKPDSEYCETQDNEDDDDD